ncbi:MAG TPA: ribbon-helix-helix domain-containing protein [Gaiellaceae bacterium]|nr:ribbon-helix-helix domain-containing protein [Gaiellaceae bacterium]
MTVQIPIRIPDEDLAELDAAIARGSFPNRSAALRAGLDLLLREERERAIDEAYRRGYGAHPQEDWVGQDGLALFEALVRAEESGAEPL